MNDIRYAIRVISRAPGLAVVVVLTLALGIGVNTAVFSVVNAVLLRPLPFAEPHRLVHIWARIPERNVPIALTEYNIHSEWRAQSTSFESMSAYMRQSANLTSGNEPERIRLMRVNASLFPMLGVSPAIGRPFSAADDTPGAPNVVILGHGVWQRRFGSDPTLPGRSVVLDGKSYEVVGVMPAAFALPGNEADMYAPIAASTARGGPWSYGTYARLKPGASIQRAQAEIDAICTRIAQQRLVPKGWGARVWGMHEFLIRDVRLSVMVLLAAVALVLLIACVNVANLLLARAAARQREMAVRIALGASRWRLLRQLIAEIGLLGAIGTAAGLGLAWAGVRALPLVAPENFPFLKAVSIDARVLAFTIGASLFTTALFGAAPAFAALRAKLSDNLKEGGRGAGEGVHRARFRSVLVVTEVAFAVLLVIGAALVVFSLMRLQSVNPGFQADNAITASLVLSNASYPQPEQRIAAMDRVLARIRAIPGVQVASMVSILPFSGMNSGEGLIIEGAPPRRPNEVPILWRRIIEPRYFEAMRIPLINGRFFTEQDGQGTRVAIINQTMARRYWPGKDAVGKRFGNGRDWITVVGVTGDIRHMNLAQEPEPEFFLPYKQDPAPSMTLVVRTASDPLRMAPAIRAAVFEIDKELPLANVDTVSHMTWTSTANQRFSVALLVVFAVLALALAAVGIYGVISYSVARRTQEIGVRMALGAARGNVARMVVGQAALLSGIGVLIGIAGGAALTRLMRALLYHTSATDPGVFAGACALLMLVAALAAYMPARRAAAVDPIVALREE